MQTIVVGMDDSANARAALRWALDHSGSDDQVVAVHAWHLPVASGYETAFLDPAVFEQSARALLEAVVADVVDDDEAGRVRQVVAPGQSSSVVLEQAADADMIVLGARGHGGFVGLLLGSVTTAVVNHATCPTVIVPLPSED